MRNKLVYVQFVSDIETTDYEKVSRYTTSAFMRLKLGKYLRRTVASHIFETKADADKYLGEAS